MTPGAVVRILWSGTAFIAAVIVLWLTYRAVSHAVNTKFSFKEWIDDLASVNFRMVVALGLFAVTVLVLLAGVVINAGGMFRADLDPQIVQLILLAEFGAMGWDVIGFIGKRVTYKPGAPDSRRPADPPEEPEPEPDVQPLTSRNQTDFTPRPK